MCLFVMFDWLLVCCCWFMCGWFLIMLVSVCLVVVVSCWCVVCVMVSWWKLCVVVLMNWW